MKTRQMLTTLLLLACFVTMRAQHAQVCKPCPDFARWMEMLSNNRRIYNDFNDSIFTLRDHNAWLNFIRHRALRNRQLFQSNKTAIETITGYFDQDPELISQEAYEQFYLAVTWLRTQQDTDPFLNLTFNKILERYYQHCPDSVSHLPRLNWYMGIDYYSIYSLCNDTTLLRKSYNYFQKDLTETRPAMHDYQSARLVAYNNLVRPVWALHQITPIDTLWKHYDLYKKEYQQADVHALFNKSTIEKDQKRMAAFPDLIVRNLYMKYPHLFDKQRADSLMRTIVEQNMRKKHLEPFAYGRNLLMRRLIGQLTFNEALQLYVRNYDKEKKRLGKQRISEETTRDLLLQCTDIFYLIDMADLPIEKKQRMTRSVLHDIIRFSQQRRNAQHSYGVHNQLNVIIGYERAMKYLTEKERLKFLDEVIVTQQLPTYAHSIHVAIMAKKLTEDIISKEPSLLIGVNGCKTVADVKRQSQTIIDLVYYGARYHDIGKCAIAPVVSDDFRPLLDEEFALIKQHSEYADIYLRIVPSLMKYRDIIMGHHKWFDGKGGYPDSFDNTQSPLRTLIDIVAISDCLQAATEKVGRNYKRQLPFDEVMQEMRDQSGTRYNPDIVRFIDSNNDVKRTLRRQVEQGWINIYYRIYQKYFH